MHPENPAITHTEMNKALAEKKLLERLSSAVRGDVDLFDVEEETE